MVRILPQTQNVKPQTLGIYFHYGLDILPIGGVIRHPEHLDIHVYGAYSGVSGRFHGVLLEHQVITMIKEVIY